MEAAFVSDRLSAVAKELKHIQKSMTRQELAKSESLRREREHWKEERQKLQSKCKTALSAVQKWKKKAEAAAVERDSYAAQLAALKQHYGIAGGTNGIPLLHHTNAPTASRGTSTQQQQPHHHPSAAFPIYDSGEKSPSEQEVRRVKRRIERSPEEPMGNDATDFTPSKSTPEVAQSVVSHIDQAGAPSVRRPVPVAGAAVEEALEVEMNGFAEKAPAPLLQCSSSNPTPHSLEKALHAQQQEAFGDCYAREGSEASAASNQGIEDVSAADAVSDENMVVEERRTEDVGLEGGQEQAELATLQQMEIDDSVVENGLSASDVEAAAAPSAEREHDVANVTAVAQEARCDAADSHDVNDAVISHSTAAAYSERKVEEPEEPTRSNAEVLMEAATDHEISCPASSRDCVERSPVAAPASSSPSPERSDAAMALELIEIGSEAKEKTSDADVTELPSVVSAKCEANACVPQDENVEEQMLEVEAVVLGGASDEVDESSSDVGEPSAKLSQGAAAPDVASTSMPRCEAVGEEDEVASTEVPPSMGEVPWQLQQSMAPTYQSLAVENHCGGEDSRDSVVESHSESVEQQPMDLEPQDQHVEASQPAASSEGESLDLMTAALPVRKLDNHDVRSVASKRPSGGGRNGGWLSKKTPVWKFTPDADFSDEEPEVAKKSVGSNKRAKTTSSATAALPQPEAAAPACASQSEAHNGARLPSSTPSTSAARPLSPAASSRTNKGEEAAGDAQRKRPRQQNPYEKRAAVEDKSCKEGDGDGTSLARRGKSKLSLSKSAPKEMHLVGGKLIAVETVEVLEDEEKEQQQQQQQQPRGANGGGGGSSSTTREGDKWLTSGRRTSTEPNYAYQEVVRGRAQREAMRGVDCPHCEAFADEMVRVGAIDDRQEMLNVCSRHRVRRGQPSPPRTPPGFWRLTFPDSAPTRRPELGLMYEDYYEGEGKEPEREADA